MLQVITLPCLPLPVEEDLHSSFDAYQGYGAGRPSTNPMGGVGLNASGTLGSHLSPNGAGTVNGRTFADMHEVHYAPNGSYQGNNTQANPVNYHHGSATSLNQGDMVPNFNVNATVHSQHQQQSTMYDNSGYRPDTRTPLGMASGSQMGSHRDSGLPGKNYFYLDIYLRTN